MEQIQQAVPATTDAAVIVSSSTAVVTWARFLKQILASIANYDGKIDELARAHPDDAIMRSFPGAGPALTPRLIAAMGSRRERYQRAEEIQQDSGIAPGIASSGQQRWVHWRWSCPRFLGQTFFEWALHSIAHSSWAREYYNRQRAKGEKPQHGGPRLGVQMDSYSVSLLERP